MKNKTKTKRWHLQPFMKEIIGRLKKNGKIIMATNIKEYALEYEENMNDRWHLKCTSKNKYDLEAFKKSGLSFRTHFEKKYLLDGQTIYNFEYSLK